MPPRQSTRQAARSRCGSRSPIVFALSRERLNYKPGEESFMSQLAGLAVLLLLSSHAAGLIAGGNLAQSETVAQTKRESEFDAKRREEASKNPQHISLE
jgi:hypothetical protein